MAWNSFNTKLPTRRCMGVVRLGKIHLRWCRDCNLPVLEAETCGRCGGRTEQVDVTPPGDVRPAFEGNLRLLREVVDRQFGGLCGSALFPEGKIVLMNKIPALDRMDEVIADGEVVGTLRYDIGRGWKFLLRMSGARVIQGRVTKGYAIADDGAVDAIAMKGFNLMAPGAVEVSDDLQVGDEVIVLTGQRNAIATGAARMSKEDIRRSSRGLAVKSRWTGAPAGYDPKAESRTWADVIEANSDVMRSRVREAAQFIRNVTEKYGLPTVVSFSGGKDSLASLLLCLDAGYRFPILFLDTGLEFPETIEHVKDVARRHGLELMVERAPGGAFFDNLGFFGPPGRDYRWCCKTNKLGPTVKMIMSRFPGGVLSFIGQRRYESEQRSEKPRVWKNPWTPGQVGASLIQDWTSLHVWLYIFSKGEDYNEWYDKGLDRIGCYLCPASDLAELDLVERECGIYPRWRKYLEDYASSRGFPKKWVDLALWRWKVVPESIKEEVGKLGLAEEIFTRKEMNQEVPIERGKGLTLHMQEGFSPCVYGYSIEGAFDRPLDLEKVSNLLNIVGEVELNPEDGWCLVDNIRIFQEGVLIAKGRNPQEIKEKVEKVRRAVVKAMECVGCGVCVARCDQGALMLQKDRIRVLTTKCKHCGRCIEPCPAVSFGDSAFEF